MDLNEKDFRENVGKATYKEIKDYVLDKYDTIISSLYIAQIKRKCGLEFERNMDKDLDDYTNGPQCPSQKEEYIMDAFRHFNII
jgi:23S rRNA (uracil1939-C5)-methyltransferase